MIRGHLNYTNLHHLDGRNRPRFATAAVDGKATPSLEPLPDDIRLWLVNLSDAQLEVLAEADFSECQRHLTGSVPLAGVPVVGSIKSKEPEPEQVRTAEIIRPKFGGVPAGGYTRASQDIDQVALAAEVAAQRAARDRIFGMKPIEEIAKALGLEVSHAFDLPKPLPVAPEPRTPMAMSSRP